MVRKVLLAVALCGAASLGGCAGQVTHDTPSGKVEEVFGASPDKVKPVLVSLMVNDGFNLTRDTNYQLAFDKPVQNVLAAALLGSKYDATPNERVSLMLVPVGPNTRVILDISVVTNPGSAFERLTPLNNGPDSARFQAALDQTSANFNWVPKP